MKITKGITALPLLCVAIALHGCINVNKNTDAEIFKHLNHWLDAAPKDRTPLTDLDFAKAPLTKSQAEQAAALLLADKQSRMRTQYEKQWDDRQLKVDNHTMPFYYNIFGDEPADGRSLFISMHGGGGTTPAMNDQQYENQKHLYDATMKGLEGVYLSPRAPTNTWDLWHQDHIDDFMNIIIQMAVIKLNVNPNKVYVMGYSAGGDGVYQLAPRMADRWAAASMMAGHPNDASPLSLRNTPFVIRVGALDDAYDRNLIAQQWGAKLDSLQRADPEGYIHNVDTPEGMGHWMKLKDAVALPWMQQYTRNPIPQKVVWKQDNRKHSTFYWLGMPEGNIKDGATLVAEYDTNLNEVNILEKTNDTIQLFLNDNMLDLDQPVTIKYQGKVIGKKVFKRSIANLYQNINRKGDANFTFPSVVTVVENKEILD